MELAFPGRTIRSGGCLSCGAASQTGHTPNGSASSFSTRSSDGSLALLKLVISRSEWRSERMACLRWHHWTWRKLEGSLLWMKYDSSRCGDGAPSSAWCLRLTRTRKLQKARARSNLKAAPKGLKQKEKTEVKAWPLILLVPRNSCPVDSVLEVGALRLLALMRDEVCL